MGVCPSLDPEVRVIQNQNVRYVLMDGIVIVEGDFIRRDEGLESVQFLFFHHQGHRDPAQSVHVQRGYDISRCRDTLGY